MYKNILITGGSTKISSYLKKLIGRKYKIYSPSKKDWNLSNPNFSQDKINLIKKCDKIFLFHSILSNKKHLSKNFKEIYQQLNINLLSTINICEIALSNNKNVQIFILGSESGVKGSYDIIILKNVRIHSSTLQSIHSPHL